MVLLPTLATAAHVSHVSPNLLQVEAQLVDDGPLAVLQPSHVRNTSVVCLQMFLVRLEKLLGPLMAGRWRDNQGRH